MLCSAPDVLLAFGVAVAAGVTGVDMHCPHWLAAASGLLPSGVAQSMRNTQTL